MKGVGEHAVPSRWCGSTGTRMCCGRGDARGAGLRSVMPRSCCRVPGAHLPLEREEHRNGCEHGAGDEPGCWTDHQDGALAEQSDEEEHDLAWSEAGEQRKQRDAVPGVHGVAGACEHDRAGERRATGPDDRRPYGGQRERLARLRHWSAAQSGEPSGREAAGRVHSGVEAPQDRQQARLEGPGGRGRVPSAGQRRGHSSRRGNGQWGEETERSQGRAAQTEPTQLGGTKTEAVAEHALAVLPGEHNYMLLPAHCIDRDGQLGVLPRRARGKRTALRGAAEAPPAAETGTLRGRSATILYRPTRREDL